MFLICTAVPLRCLEVMCGAGVWSDGMGELGWEVVKNDLLLGPLHDLQDEGLVTRYESQLRQGWYRAFHVGTCCATFSRACSQAYRTNTDIYGVPGLSREKRENTNSVAYMPQRSCVSVAAPSASCQ